MTTEPTFERVPEGDEAAGRDALELAEAYGIPLDDWQQDIVRKILRETDGNWSASQAGVVVSRQSGKGNCLLAVELYGLVSGESILHTAHQVKTSSDAFRRLRDIFDGHADLAIMVQRRSEQLGAEYLQLTNGARIAFTTRSASSGRGLTIDRLIVDEAEDFPAAEVGALLPTVFSRPRAQSLFFGTAPGPFHDSEAFVQMRRNAHEGLQPRQAWFEWSAEYGTDIDDEEMWERVNPAVASGRVSLQAIRDDRAILPADQFRAERLSMWVPSGAGRVFEESDWSALLDEDSAVSKGLVLGVDCPPSRDSATVCVAGRCDDGQLHLEWYQTGEGVTWLPDWIRERLDQKVRAVVLDGRNPLAELDWRAAGVRPTVAGTRDIAAAAGVLFDGVADRHLHHRGQVELSRGVLGAVRRPMLGGQAFGWDRKAPGSSVLIAASLAVWGVDALDVQRPRRPKPGEAKPRRAIVLA